MTLLLVFLVILVAPYALLLWLSYLHHLESRDAGDGHVVLPPVTIIVPVYNEAAVVQAALRSLLNLDYPAFEVLVVDDGSSDATFALASHLEGTYGSVTVRVVAKAN